MDLDKVKIYRITHIVNIPHILENGITHKNSPKNNPDYKTIGDISLIANRSSKLVFIDNGDLYLKNKSVRLRDYIPFYFGVRMPMLYVTQNGGNFVKEPTDPANIIYLVCSLSNIITSNIDFIFTDGHATDALTSFYEKTKINELNDIVDWVSIKLNYWGGDENLNKKRKKQAEFLVSGDLSPDQIIGFVCYNEQSKKKLLSFGITEDKIKVFPSAYY